MKRALLISVIIAASALVINSAYARPTHSTESFCDGTNEHPCLVQDSDDTANSVKNYRDSTMLAAAYQGDTTGLGNLWISGSATPDQHDLTNIAHTIQVTTHYHVKKIIDLDLREESHGFINEKPLTLTSKNDWINLGKSHEQIIIDEAAWLDSLLNQKTVANVLTPAQFKTGDFTHGNDIIIDSIQSEENIANKLGFIYIRLTITDHMAPNASDVDQFIMLVDQLPTDTWLYLHCRGGKGRTTTFLAMYDMLHNAGNVSFDDIIKRQASVAPFENLSQIDKKNPELMEYYLERYEFLKKFYLYAQAHSQGYPDSWSAWINRQ